ncbi:hypothetical protein WL55_30480 [Burkholderia cepacia]|uniref:DUF2147 domain-containing protein n=1 Tax=Burkholderia cepacia TaxID=292 RepID=UPI00076CC39B|nr:DUF2147 domain-containing protein [Burkholderia cepacia]KWC61454.1 hypothetical protein WL55_30480 [Burkholderia cepacia]
MAPFATGAAPSAAVRSSLSPYDPVVFRGRIGGSLYDDSSGRTYACKATIKDGKMLLRGYLGISAPGQTGVFHRVNG